MISRTVILPRTPATAFALLVTLSLIALGNMLVAYSNSGTIAAIHTYFLDTNGQKTGEIDPTGVTGTSNGTATTKFYLNDWQNSVSTLTDSSGNVLEADSYDAWGKRRNLNGTPDVNDTINSQTQYGYTNQEHLQDLQLINLNARVYDPYIATLLTVDPAVTNWLDPQTWNAYTYARDNPMRYTDPNGMAPPQGPTNSGIDPCNELCNIPGGLAPGDSPAPASAGSGSSGSGQAYQVQTVHTDYAHTTSSAGSSQTEASGSSLAADPDNEMSAGSGAGFGGGYDPLEEYAPGITSGVQDDLLQALSDTLGAIPMMIGPEGGVVDAFAAEGLSPYSVGTFDALKGSSVMGDALDIHHVVQSSPAGQIISGYLRSNSPSIALPEAEHALIPTIRGAYSGSARDLLATDINNLRNFTNAPNSALQKLINLNKSMYPDAFSK